MVRLKEATRMNSPLFISFQFLMVRLKELPVGRHLRFVCVSIPYGSIKSYYTWRQESSGTRFNSLWFD